MSPSIALRTVIRTATSTFPAKSCKSPQFPLSPISSSLPRKRAFHYLPQDPFRPAPAAKEEPASPTFGSLVAERVKTASRTGGGGGGGGGGGEGGGGEWGRKIAAVGIGAGVAWLGYQTVFANGSGSGLVGTAHCDSLPTAPPPDRSPSAMEPHSILSVYELSFGAVCGICTGVFVKKGARALAFVLGGVFVLLQYLSSKSIINVNWSKVSSKYDSAFGSSPSLPGQGSRAPTIGGLYQWFVDFVTANFQQRASFLAGVALGLRLG